MIIPVNIISGFLGSGKTTAIIHLLGMKQPEERWAIVVNEFGKVAIDGSILRSKSVESSVFDIVGGCICCSARIYQSQIQKAERIVFSKCDMPDEAILTQQIENFKEVFPGKEYLQGQQLSVDILYSGNAVASEKTYTREFSHKG